MKEQRAIAFRKFWRLPHAVRMLSLLHDESIHVGESHSTYLFLDSHHATNIV